MTHAGDFGHLRVDDVGREEARMALGRHFSAGRIDYAEYEDRVGVAMTARTFADLRPLFADLPEPHPRSLAPQGPAPALPNWGPAASPAPYQQHVPAPYGVEPRTGRPYSDKQRVVAGLLQVFLGCFGVGRFYTGHSGIGLAQLLLTMLTFGLFAPVTVVWGVIDGVLMLTGGVTDNLGRPLR